MRTHAVLLLAVLIGCNAPSGSNKGPSASPTPVNDSIGDIAQPQPSVVPTATPWTDHSYRNNAPYGTMPTAEDCAYIAKWTPSLNETWYFGGYSGENAVTLNREHHLRFSQGSVVFRNWNQPENRFINQQLTNELFVFGDCTIVIKTSTSIDYVMWRNVVIH